MVRKELGLSYSNFLKFLDALPTIDSFTSTTARPAMSAKKFQLMFKLMFYCGLRPNECFELKKSDVNLEQYELFVKRSHFSVTDKTTIPPNIVGLLSDHIEDLTKHQLLFSSKSTSKKFKRSTPYLYAKLAGKKAGLELFKPTKIKSVEGISLLIFRDSLEQYMKECKADKNLIELKLRKRTPNDYGNKDLEDLKKWEQKQYCHSLSENEINNYLEWYVDNQDSFKSLLKKVKEILEDIISKRKIPYQDIQYREKNLKKFETKIRNGVHYDPKYMQDLSGIRIICYTKSDVLDVCKAIKDTFDVEDRSKKLGPTEMGYTSFTFVSKFTKERMQSSEELSDFRNKHFEIQVRTVLQHAWAELEHDDLYKNIKKLSEETQRRFYLVSSILESADNELETLHRTVKN